MKKLSVIITVYNVELYLEQCINSVLNQTYKELDIILVDDGSSDNSGKICDEYQRRNSNIIVIHQHNQGMIAARACGLSQANTEYVTFVDGDDFIAYDMYEFMMKYIDKYHPDVITAGAYRYWDNSDYILDKGSAFGKGLYSEKELNSVIFPEMLWCMDMERWKLDPSLCFKIMKTDILSREYNYLKEQVFNYGEDSALMYPLLLQCKKIYITNKYFYYHRQRPRNVIAPYMKTNDFFERLFDLYKYLKNRFQQLQKLEIMEKQLEMFYIKSLQVYKTKKYGDLLLQNNNKWLFPFDKVPHNSNIVLYGAGKAGQVYYNQVKKINYCNIKIWVDKNPILEGVVNYNEIFNTDFDKIVISIQNKEIAKKIAEDLVEKGVDVRDVII